MARVIITKALQAEILRRFKKEAIDIFLHMRSLEEQPKKGKNIAHIGNIVIKEIKYKKFRFYYLTDGHTLKYGSVDEIAAMIIKFVKMSEKKNQQKAIDELKMILQQIGFEGF